jgi:hypothetical protein
MTRSGASFPAFAISGALAASLGLTSATAAIAGPLEGKTYIIEMSSSQNSSGYSRYLVPPLAKTLNEGGLKSKNGPGADFVANVVTRSDVGQWMKTGSGRQWLYTVTITVGISPESYSIPYEGTPKFGVAAMLVTPNGDREDELACLIGLATRTAVEKYKPAGFMAISGDGCLRQ